MVSKYTISDFNKAFEVYKDKAGKETSVEGRMDFVAKTTESIKKKMESTFSTSEDHIYKQFSL